MPGGGTIKLIMLNPTEKPTASLIIPVFNERESVAVLYRELIAITQPLPITVEFVFVDDGSTDGSVEQLATLAKTDVRVKVIEFTRNFGKEMATTAGLRQCRGDAAIMLDADGQHPAALVPELIKHWQTGAEMVVGVRTANQNEPLFKRIGSWLFYTIINAIGETKVRPQSTDFRLIDRFGIDQFLMLTEHQRMTRSLFDWLGLKTEYVKFVAPPRRHGTARYSFIKLLKLAISTFVANSLVPLKIAGYLGIFITFFSGLFGIFILVEKYIFNDPWHMSFSGPAMLATLNLFLIGIVLSCLGLIALYVANIHREVANRPLYVIRRQRNINSSPELS